VFSQYGANFFKTMYMLLQTRDTLNIINDQHGAPTAAHHIARAVSDLIKTPSKYPYGIYHITGAGKTSWHGFAVEIQKLMTAAGIKSPTHLCEVATKDYPTKAKRPLNSQLECDIFKLPKWQDSLAEVFNFYESIK
jgi:dTDP-4-dehydrorhamnose reductase